METKYIKKTTPTQNNSYYSIYSAYDCENDRDVLWIDVAIEGSQEEDIQNYMNSAFSCINNNPDLFVEFYDYCISSDGKLLSITTEKTQYGCVADFVKEQSDFFSLVSRYEDYIGLVQSWLLSLLKVMEVIQVSESPLFMNFLSTNSLYFMDEYKTIKFAPLPLVLNSQLFSSYDVIRYLPIETIENQVFNSSSAMYSLGVCLFEMVTKSNLFTATDVSSLLQQKCNETLIQSQITSIQDIFFKDLVIRLLGPSSDRPSFQSILHELEWIQTDVSTNSIEAIRQPLPTMRVLMNSKSSPLSSLRNSINLDDLELPFPNFQFSSEFDSLGNAVPVEFFKLNLTFELPESAISEMDKETLSLSILSRINYNLKLKVTRRKNLSKSSCLIIFKYGEMPVSRFVSRLVQLNLVPEVLVENVTENIELWLDNFVKREFGDH